MEVYIYIFQGCKVLRPIVCVCIIVKKDLSYLNGAVEETVVLTRSIEQSFSAGETGIMIIGR